MVSLFATSKITRHEIAFGKEIVCKCRTLYMGQYRRLFGQITSFLHFTKIKNIANCRNKFKIPKQYCSSRRKQEKLKYRKHSAQEGFFEISSKKRILKFFVSSKSSCYYMILWMFSNATCANLFLQNDLSSWRGKSQAPSFNVPSCPCAKR